jgi:hypothetical protein
MASNWLTALKAQATPGLDWSNPGYKMMLFNQSGTANSTRLRVFTNKARLELYYDNAGQFRNFKLTNMFPTVETMFFEYNLQQNGTLLYTGATTQTANQSINVTSWKCISGLAGEVQYPFQSSEFNAHPTLVRPFPFAGSETFHSAQFDPDPNPTAGGGGAAPTPPPTEITERDAKIIGFVLMLYVSIAIVKLFRFKETN